jgi:hypothetical protein
VQQLLRDMSSSDEEEFDGEEESDDEPLSNLKALNGKSRSSSKHQDDESEGEVHEAADDDGDDDDNGEEDYEEEEEKPRAAKKSKPNYAEESSDEDDDDIPLAALASNKKPTNGDKKRPSATKKATPTKAKGTKTKKSPATKEKKKKPAAASKASVSSTPKSGNDSYQSPSAALYGTECQKGLLIQRLLCRWWFAIQWPDPASIPSKPPQHYDALDGFPGVYVCTEGEDVGKIMDVRDKDKCPSFKNFAKKSSEELQQLLLDALQNQKKELVKVDGPGTPTEQELDSLIKWATKLKASTAEKEAAKVLKASKLTLD